MKKHILPALFYILLFTTSLLLLQACGHDSYTKLQHKWRITTDEVTLELHTDSSFVLIQQRNAPVTGTWKLANHAKTIIFKEKGSTEKKMEIKELTNTRLIMSNNGEELDYIRAD